MVFRNGILPKGRSPFRRALDRREISRCASGSAPGAKQSGTRQTARQCARRIKSRNKTLRRASTLARH